MLLLLQVVRQVLGRLCQLFLSSEYSDSLLSIGPLRRFVAWALSPVCKQRLLQALTPPSKNRCAQCWPLVH